MPVVNTHVNAFLDLCLLVRGPRYHEPMKNRVVIATTLVAEPNDWESMCYAPEQLLDGRSHNHSRSNR